MTKRAATWGKKGTSGFTLVELSVVILILGTIIALIATGYNNYQIRKNLETNQNRITAASEKIYEFRKIHGFYPCPAPLNAQRDNAD